MPRLRNPIVPRSESAPDPEIQLLRSALERAQGTLRELRALVDQITAPPLHPCLLQRIVTTPGGQRALVSLGAASRLVTIHPEVPEGSLAVGDVIYLDPQQRTVLGRAEGVLAPATDSARYVRTAEDGRLVVRARDDEMLLEAAARMRGERPRAGDVVLFDRTSHLALELLPSSAGRQYLMEDAGNAAPDAIGGRRESLDELVAVLTAALVAPELAARYALGGRRAILLHGPPGCGKTLLARTAAAELQRRSGRRCRFAVVRPGEFESPYVGESEANLRACFAALAEEAEGGLALVFLDEIEAIGRIRGARGARHADRLLAALLAEIDGFRSRGQVAILAATNRRDLLDPALLSRLSDVQIAVPRPDVRSARGIFAVHLPESLPYRRSGTAHAAVPGSREAAGLREEILESAASLLYAPNAGNEVARITLRDGVSRTVRAGELVSGRLIEQICLSVRERAFRRDARSEGAGLSAPDASDAVAEALARLSTTLSIHNARAHLEDLPDDVDVVRVEPLRALPDRRHRYRHAS